MNKRTKAVQFSKDTKIAILQRERGECFFCKRSYKMPHATLYEQSIMDIMHFVNKSAGGLGIEENGVLGCRYHHSLLDNGNKGYRAEMLTMMEEYLKSKYSNWNKDNLYYKKG